MPRRIKDCCKKIIPLVLTFTLFTSFALCFIISLIYTGKFLDEEGLLQYWWTYQIIVSVEIVIIFFIIWTYHPRLYLKYVLALIILFEEIALLGPLFYYPYLPVGNDDRIWQYVGIVMTLGLLYSQTSIASRYVYLTHDVSKGSWLTYLLIYPATFGCSIIYLGWWIGMLSPLILRVSRDDEWKLSIRILLTGYYILSFVYWLRNIRTNQELIDGVWSYKRYSVYPPSKQMIIKEEMGASFNADLGQALKIIQITDIHLGDFCSISRIQSLCEQVVAQNPDLVLITGDFYNPAGAKPGNLAESFKALKTLKGRVFACLGNHDIEHPDLKWMIIKELQECEIEVLVDDFRNIKLDLNGTMYPFQIVGLFWYSEPASEIPDLISTVMRDCDKNLPKDAFRIVLLHNPFHFKHIKEDFHGAVFAGHTHGGMHSAFRYAQILCPKVLPVQGGFQDGKKFLYVHRGQGSRSLGANLMSRMGVPLEHSIMTLYFQDPTSIQSGTIDIVSRNEKQNISHMSDDASGYAPPSIELDTQFKMSEPAINLTPSESRETDEIQDNLEDLDTGVKLLIPHNEDIPQTTYI